MKVAVVGSHLCPDTLGALYQLSGMGASIAFKDILSYHTDLRAYLDLHDNSGVYTEIRGTERLDVPCFVCEDGTVTLDIQAVLREQSESFGAIVVRLLIVPGGYESSQGRFSIRGYEEKRFR